MFMLVYAFVYVCLCLFMLLFMLVYAFVYACLCSLMLLFMLVDVCLCLFMYDYAIVCCGMLLFAITIVFTNSYEQNSQFVAFFEGPRPYGLGVNLGRFSGFVKSVFKYSHSICSSFIKNCNLLAS